ncbi:hypothetical protein [Streptococcus tangpeifui]|uniref:hypothetical protein n=1 Tax=Streptococcus tangpeifui TaxID=2709400 RepID=UPI0013EA7058|nr:hypothetical protein [Streptococcus sp. ZJ373]
MNIVFLDTTAFDKFEVADMDTLANLEGGFNGEGVVTSILAMIPYAAARIAYTNSVGAALYIGAEACAGAAAIYYSRH